MMKSLRMKLVAIALAAVVALGAPIAVPFTGNVAVAEAATVKISKTKVSMEVGATTTLTVKGTKSKVTWKTGNKKVASVSSKGVVTAKSAGVAKITATVSKKKYTCTVTVIDPVVEDYNQLLIFVKGLNAHIGMAGQVDEYNDQYLTGTITEAVLISAYQQLADDSQYLLELYQEALWYTNTYDSQILLLNDTLEALVKYEALLYEGMANNDESKITEAQDYLKIYNSKLDEFLTAMGV